LSKDYYQLLERHVIRTASFVTSAEELSSFNTILNQLTRNRHFQQSEAIKDICCKLLVERYAELSHSDFATLCRTLSVLSIVPGSLQHKNITTAMKEYLQLEENQHIDAKTMYSIARTIRLGNKRVGGVSFSSSHIDMMVCARILGDKVKLLEEMKRRYSPGAAVP
jgi:hypothetical protein